MHGVARVEDPVEDALILVEVVEVRQRRRFHSREAGIECGGAICRGLIGDAKGGELIVGVSEGIRRAGDGAAG